MQKKITKETENDRKKRVGHTDAVRKHVVKFNTRQDTYKALVSKTKDKEKYSAAKLKIWCSFQKKKEDGVISPKVEEVRAHATMLED